MLQANVFASLPFYLYNPYTIRENFGPSTSVWNQEYLNTKYLSLTIGEMLTPSRDQIVYFFEI